jgi:aspartate/methionine/tyrosine aminotransferase
MVSGSPDWDPPDALRDGLREETAGRRSVDRSRVLVTNGAGEANHLAMTGAIECGQGDEIVLSDPVYPYYAGRANMLGADSVFVPVERDGQLDPAAVRAAAGPETVADRLAAFFE